MLNCSNNKGLTVVELIVSIAVLSAIFAMSAVSIFRIIPRADLTQLTASFIADAKSQQHIAMLGEGAGPTLSDYSIRIESHRYILFRGEVFIDGAVGNYPVSYPEGTTAQTTFLDDKIVFSALTGEVENYDGSANQVVFHGYGDVSATIKLNKLGNVYYVNQI